MSEDFRIMRMTLVATVVVLIAFAIGGSLSEYQKHREAIEAMKLGYEQKVIDNKAVWVKKTEVAE